ncbi:hypothetical protein BCR34DRAFT_600680 [Clohesyomyces aquaticus]|uniref:Mid2 domain-containing protein n=1 Tax=Clohesyomyces aquaticus TaxID=1231657 RepID=A0A1Y1ZR65_9PLEO|nr:hypothetical protein BCR34DRAFT_600680 [Clohesyomyces aquaticus]
MRSQSMVSLMFLNSVWVVYGVVVPADESCRPCISTSETTLASNWSSSAGTSRVTIWLSLSTSSPTPLTDPYSTFAASPPVLTTHTIVNPSHHPSPFTSSSPVSATATVAPLPSTAKQTKGLSSGAKLGVGASVGVLALAAALVALFDMFYLRRKRLERRVGYARHEVERGTGRESSEHIFLESGVEVICAEEDEDRARNGMSLPRRG